MYDEAYQKGTTDHNDKDKINKYLGISFLISIVCFFGLIAYGQKYYSLITEVENKNEIIENLETKNENLSELEDLLSDEASWYEEYAAICVSGDNTYHTYNCSLWAASDSFLIFNIDEAERQGYYPCPYCH